MKTQSASYLLLAVVSLICAGLFVGPAHADKPATALTGATPITVKAIPIDFDREHPEHKQFGKLIYRSGVTLYTPNPYFGGFSTLALDASGKTLVSISDAGIWLRATLDYDGRELKGVSNAVLGPLRGADGKPLLDNRERDSESMTLVSGDLNRGTCYIGFERHHRIMRYPFDLKKFGPPNGGVPLPPGASKMSFNSGIEALTILRAGPLKGTLVAFAEDLTDANGNLQGWLIGGPSPGPITLKRIGGFDVTDATALPDGGILVLERRFRYSEGIKMRVRRIAADELKHGTVIEGDTLLEATGDSNNIDNMEGIATFRDSSGETVISIISDDNYFVLERTLILQFTLPDADPKEKVANPAR